MSDLGDFSVRLGQLEIELADAIESGNERATIGLYFARAAAWRAFAQIQKDAGRDHVQALGAAARDEAKAAELQDPGDTQVSPGHDPMAYAAGGAAVVGLFLLPIIFGPLAVILGTASRRNDFRSGSAILMGIGEVLYYLYTIGVIHA